MHVRHFTRTHDLGELCCCVRKRNMSWIKFTRSKKHPRDCYRRYSYGKSVLVTVNGRPLPENA